MKNVKPSIIQRETGRLPEQFKEKEVRIPKTESSLHPLPDFSPEQQNTKPNQHASPCFKRISKNTTVDSIKKSNSFVKPKIKNLFTSDIAARAVYFRQKPNTSKQIKQKKKEKLVKKTVLPSKNEIVRPAKKKSSMSLGKLNMKDFDSDSENSKLTFSEHSPNKLPIIFLNLVNAKRSDLNNIPNNTFDLVDFVQRRDDKTRTNKVYACKYCDKVYSKRAALGGHTAKNHPHLSDNYKLRQISMKSRKIERERFNFYKDI